MTHFKVDFVVLLSIVVCTRSDAVGLECLAHFEIP